MELPIVGAIVHAACYERETGQPARRPMTVKTALAALVGRGPRRKAPETRFVEIKVTARKEPNAGLEDAKDGPAA